MSTFLRTNICVLEIHWSWNQVSKASFRSNDFFW